MATEPSHGQAGWAPLRPRSATRLRRWAPPWTDITGHTLCGVFAGQGVCSAGGGWCPRQDSNLRPRLRRAVDLGRPIRGLSWEDRFWTGTEPTTLARIWHGGRPAGWRLTGVTEGLKVRVLLGEQSNPLTWPNAPSEFQRARWLPVLVPVLKPKQSGARSGVDRSAQCRPPQPAEHPRRTVPWSPT